MNTRNEDRIKDHLRPTRLANHVANNAPTKAPAWMTDTMLDDSSAVTVEGWSMSP